VKETDFQRRDRDLVHIDTNNFLKKNKNYICKFKKNLKIIFFCDENLKINFDVANIVSTNV
jgi:hypothetical protein